MFTLANPLTAASGRVRARTRITPPAAAAGPGAVYDTPGSVYDTPGGVGRGPGAAGRAVPPPAAHA